MKVTHALSTVLVLLPLINAIALPAQGDASEIQRRDNTVVGRGVRGRIVARQNVRGGRNRNGGNRNNNNNGGNNNQNGGNNNQNGGNNNQNGGNNDNQNGGNNDNQNGDNQNGDNQNGDNQNGDNNNGGNNNDNPQESLTLLQELVAPGLAQDGQDPPVDGQVASLTSKNNFINFCAGQDITNGAQVKEGSCNPVPMGDIIPQANMPSSKFQFPQNFAKIPANQPFTAEIAVQNMDTGFFTNAQKNYFSAPQQLNGQGILIAHSHIVIQPMNDFDSPNILDPLDFVFFKGLNAPAQNGVLSADVTDGVPPGKYRMGSIHSSANHAPAVAAVAQHGYFDDIVYFEAE
jgi:hypothetical protein